MAMTKFNLVVNIEVAEDKGEDANLAEDFGQTFLMGVFDGLGGRSAGYDGKTGGRIASELASQISKRFFKQWHGKITQENALQLQQQICQLLKHQADTNMPKTSSRLKGSLVEHKLCTTIALASIPKQQGQEKIFEANIAWMGDSRIYFLSPTKGLQQLTKDDLVTPKDALEMLRQDPPMSQYLTADINPKWQIHCQHYKIEEIGCFLVCTDGCFQYFSAPWEFEKLLLNSLCQSEGNTINENNWQELICQRYTEIKQDDVSLIVYPVGFASIKHLKNAYQERWHYILEKFISPTANTRYEELQTLWAEYRNDYEHYLRFIQDIQPIADSKPSVSEEKPSISVASVSSSLNTSTFQELSQSFKEKAAAKAEEIKNLLGQANSYYENARLKEAEYFCNQVLSIDEFHIESKYLLGLIYTKSAFLRENYHQKTTLFQTAISYLEEVIKISKERLISEEKLIDSYRFLGFIYNQLNQWNSAVRYYQQFFNSPGAERFDCWEEHLEALVNSLHSISSISNKCEPANVAIQFCQRLITSSLSDEKKVNLYYFMAMLQEIEGELNAATNSINTAQKICSSCVSINYEILQKMRLKSQEIQNKLQRRSY
ncbi:MAG: protein phosphatase 2C domain-containing protein [Phormidium sp.]